MVHGALEEGLLDDGTVVKLCCAGFLSKGFLRSGFHGCPWEGLAVSSFLSDGVVLLGVGFSPGG